MGPVPWRVKASAALSNHNASLGGLAFSGGGSDLSQLGRNTRVRFAPEAVVGTVLLDRRSRRPARLDRFCYPPGGSEPEQLAYLSERGSRHRLLGLGAPRRLPVPADARTVIKLTDQPTRRSSRRSKTAMVTAAVVRPNSPDSHMGGGATSVSLRISPIQ